MKVKIIMTSCACPLNFDMAGKAINIIIWAELNLMFLVSRDVATVSWIPLVAYGTLKGIIYNNLSLRYVKTLHIYHLFLLSRALI